VTCKAKAPAPGTRETGSWGDLSRKLCLVAVFAWTPGILIVALADTKLEQSFGWTVIAIGMFAITGPVLTWIESKPKRD
jgi:hypothetical protein